MLMPEGFHYWPDLITLDEEQALIAALRELDFKPFEFHGFFGNRRIVSFGWKYDFNDSKLKRAPEIPEFLHLAKMRVAQAAGLPVDAIVHALVTEYPPGAAIGWHKDKSIFEDVIGVSVCSACTFRLRRKRQGKWDRASIILEPRSAYLLRGPVRSEWEHSIPPVGTLRYSVTFRTMKRAAMAERRR